MNSDSDLSTILPEIFESFQCELPLKCTHSHLKAEINYIFNKVLENSYPVLLLIFLREEQKRNSPKRETLKTLSTRRKKNMENILLMNKTSEVFPKFLLLEHI